MKKSFKIYRWNIIIILILFTVSIFACLDVQPPTDGIDLSVTIINEDIEEDDDSNSFNLILEWKTQEIVDSIVYYGTSPTALNDKITSTKGTKLRNVTIPNLIPDTTYYYRIESTYLTSNAEHSNNLTTPSTYTLKNKLYGHIHYTEVFQPTGDFEIHVWDSADPYLFDYSLSTPVYKKTYNESDVCSGGICDFNFDILTGVGSWQLRVFRDLDVDEEHDIVTEAYNHTASTWLLSTSDVNVGNITVSEPTQEPTVVNIDPISDVKATQATTVTVTIDNQWGQPMTIDTSVDLTLSNSTNTSFYPWSTPTKTVTYSGTLLEYSGLINFDKAPSSGSQITELEAISGTASTTSAQFNITDYLIGLTINYETNDRYTGPIVIQVNNEDDNPAPLRTWSVYNQTIANALIPTGVKSSGKWTSPATLDPPYTLPDVGVKGDAAGVNYRIRAFRDENGDGDYDSLTEAYDYQDITIYTADGSVTLDVTEPSIEKTTLDVVLDSSSTIYSGGSITVDIELFDQWGQYYAEDAYYTITTEQVDFSSLNITNVLINDILNSSPDPKVDSDTVQDYNKDGIISNVVLKLYKVSYGTLGSDKTANIQGDWDSNLDTTGTITVDNNHITGSYTYNNNGYQTNGDLFIELWENTTFTTGSITEYAMSNYVNALIVNGNNVVNFDFEVPDSDGANYYLRVYRDFSGSPSDYDVTDSDDVLMDAYFVYGGGTPTSIPIYHANNALGAIGTFGNKTRVLNNVTATAAAPTSIQSGGTVTVTVTSTDQWGTAYSGGGNVNFTWLGSDVTMGTTTATSAGGTTGNVGITLTNDTAQTVNINQIQAELDGVTDATNNITIDGESPTITTPAPTIPAGAETTMVITFDETLLVNSPTISQFTIGNVGDPVNVTNVTVSGTTVTLTLSRAIEIVETGITVSYSGGTTTVKDSVGNSANNFTNVAVTNNSTVTSDPTFVSAQVPDGASTKTLIITMSEDLKINTPTASQFTVGTNADIGINVIGTSISGDTVILDLDRDVEDPEILTITYAESATAIQDLVGNHAVDFTAESVTNNSTIATPPSVVSAEIPSAGTTIIVTFNENLLINTPTASQFIISGVSPTVTVSTTSVSGSDVTLTLSRTIEDIETGILLSYNGTGLTVKDQVRNVANTFTNLSVTNSSTVVTKPSITSAVIPATGTTMVLTFDETLLVNSPTTGQFTISGGSAYLTLSVSSINVSGTDVTLTLNRTVEDVETGITISYDGSGTTIKDLIGNSANTFTSYGVTNSSTVVTNPYFVSAEIPNGAENTLTITMNENLQPNTPTVGQFSITTSADTVIGINSTSVSGTVVTLNLDRTVENPESITVTYTGGGTTIKDLAGNSAVTFTNEAVTNNSPIITRPSFVSAEVPVAGTTLRITFDEDISSTTTPSAASFVVSANETVNVSGVGVSGTVVTLTLDRTIETGETVQVTYNASGVNKVKDLVGNNANTFTNNAVTNNSTQVVPPLLSSAYVTAGGGSLVITFDETLTTNIPTETQFTISGVALAVTATAASASGTNVTLTLSRTIEDPETGILISYSGLGATTVKDSLGNNAGIFTNQSVTNNSTQTSPPVYVSSEVVNSGTEIEITFDETLLGNAPTETQFKLSGTGATVASASASGAIVTLTLNYTIQPSDSVLVSYDGSGGTTIQDILGNSASVFTNKAVTLTDPGADTIPVLVSADIQDATTIILTYDQMLTAGILNAGNFNIDNRFDDPDPLHIDTVVASGNTITITLTDDWEWIGFWVQHRIESGDSIRVDYSAGGGVIIKDADGNNATNFSNYNAEPYPYT